MLLLYSYGSLTKDIHTENKVDEVTYKKQCCKVMLAAIPVIHIIRNKWTVPVSSCD